MASRAAMARQLERHAVATDAAGAGTGGKEFAAQPGQHHKSPVVYGTRAYQGLWAQAMALGEIQAENERKNAGAENDDVAEEQRRRDESEYAETATRAEKEIGEEEEDDDDDDDDSVDDDRDPFERYSVSTVAGQSPPQQPATSTSEAFAPEVTAAPAPPASYAGGYGDDEEDDLYDLD